VSNWNHLQNSIDDMDAATRIKDTVSLHLVAASDLMDVVGHWCAFKLRDGTGDNTLYPSKDEAISHQLGNPKDYCYLRITPDGISVKDALVYLRMNRNPLIDTTAPEHIINPVLFPRFSNLTPTQRETLRKRAERDAKNAH